MEIVDQIIVVKLNYLHCTVKGDLWNLGLHFKGKVCGFVRINEKSCCGL